MDGNLQANLFKPSACVSQEELRQYLNGSLGKEGTRRVEQHLLDCPLCADAADGYSETGAQLPPSLADFSTFEKKMLGQPLSTLGGATVVPMRRGSTLRWATAVAAVLLVGLLAYFTLPDKAPDGPALYSAFYTPYQNDIPSRLRLPGTNGLDPNFAAALTAYEEGKFGTAINLFDAALHNQPSNDAARFFAGMAHLELGQADKAAAQFQPVAKGKGPYASRAAWYLALADLRQGRLDSAKARLDLQISTNGHNYRKAKELREKL